MAIDELPEFREWSVAAVRLLQGVVYADEERVWDIVRSSQSQLTGYFARLGLLLVVDHGEEMAYLRQFTDDESPEGYDALPTLFRKCRLGYVPTLLCVLLREELRRFEEEDVNNERCVVETTSISDQLKSFFPAQSDEVRQRRELVSSLSKLEELGFVRKFGDEPEAWEIRRIIRARLPAAELEKLKTQLVNAGRRRAEEPTKSSCNG